jgi:anti-sigma regulatory factor (Ser/Thr protein kinase)
MDDAETNGRAVARERPRLHLRLEATPKASSELRRSLRVWLEDVGVSDRDAFDVTLACSEAFANAVGGRVGRGAAIVEVDAELDARRVLTIVVHEHARQGLGRSSERSREETRVFLRLMETLMESAESHARADGITLVLRKRLGFWHALPAA